MAVLWASGATGTEAQQQAKTAASRARGVTADEYRGAELANQGVELLRQNRNHEAAEKLEQAVGLYPGLAEAHHNLGLALAKLGDTEGAIAALNKARSLKQIDATWLTLGGLYQAGGKIEEATAVYDEFLLRFPGHPMAAKLSTLSEGLKRELRTVQQYNAATTALQSAPAELALLEGAGMQDAQATGDDYLAEVTRNGVVRWPDSGMPIKVFIRSGDGVPGYKPEFEDILRQSFLDWQKASDGRVSFTFASKPLSSDDSRITGITCQWESNAERLPNRSEAGDTKIYCTPEGISTARITILTKPLTAALPITRNSIRLICLHEIGHALGLTGHTLNPEDIMFLSASFKDTWRELTERDARTIKRLYSSP